MMDHFTYTSPSLDDAEVDRRAVALVQAHLDGLPVGQARQILQRAERWMDALTTVDCSASDFPQAVEALRGAAAESA